MQLAVMSSGGLTPTAPPLGGWSTLSTAGRKEGEEVFSFSIFLRPLCRLVVVAQLVNEKYSRETIKCSLKY